MPLSERICKTKSNLSIWIALSNFWSMSLKYVNPKQKLKKEYSSYLLKKHFIQECRYISSVNLEIYENLSKGPFINYVL